MFDFTNFPKKLKLIQYDIYKLNKGKNSRKIVQRFRMSFSYMIDNKLSESYFAVSKCSWAQGLILRQLFPGHSTPVTID